jgi:predicted GNAT family acetyltransferase
MPEHEANNGQVIHNRQASRFEIQVDGQVAVLSYRLIRNTIVFTHTAVPMALEGHGLGSQLVRSGLEYARDQGMKVQSMCWFVDLYLERHKEYQDLRG